jgi:hypothetical protein
VIEVTWDSQTVIFLLQLTVAVFLPLLVGIVTTRVTSPARKAVLLAGLTFLTSLVAAIAEALVSGTALNLVMLLLGLFANFVIAVATYFGVWSRPTSSGESLTTKLQTSVGRRAKHL